MKQMLNMPHSVFYTDKGILLGCVALLLLAITLHTFLKTPLRHILWLLGTATIFLGLDCLETFSEASDPLYHPSTQTADLYVAALVVGGLGIVVTLVSWRAIQRETKAFAKPPTA